MNNLTPWNNNNVTFLELLKKTGYDTAFIGKWHMPGEGLPQLKGVDQFISFTVQRGQGKYFNCPLYRNGVKLPARKEYITEELTDYAIDFINQERENPFCLYLSHKAVHHQFKPPKDLKGIYRDAKLELPIESDKWLGLVNNNIIYGTLGTLDKMYRAYCETIHATDREVGRLLNHLDKSGLADNTIVIYAGDNGFFWGEHRLVDKRYAYEESIRVPFIVRDPMLIKKPGEHNKKMVLNIDLAPTLIERAGERVPDNMHGMSIVPLLKGKALWRSSWLYEYFLDFPYTAPGMYAVRTDEYKYIEYQGKNHAPELFHIANDPKEKNNLFGKKGSEEILIRLKNELESLKMDAGICET
jgi:N-acetylglucosamine-6-sulfatase